MKELKIYEFQAKDIEDTLRLVSNLHHSNKEETCLDRMIMKSTKFIDNHPPRYSQSENDRKRISTRIC